MPTTISLWGNSAGVRIPKDVLQAAGLALGDRVDFQLTEDKRVVMVPVEGHHRRGTPKTGITLDTILKNCGPVDRDSLLDPWPEDMVGREAEAWQG